MIASSEVFCKSDPEDVVLTITGGTPILLKNNGRNINTEHYTIEQGTITICGTWLATLANGIKRIEVVLESGAVLVVEIEVRED